MPHKKKHVADYFPSRYSLNGPKPRTVSKQTLWHSVTTCVFLMVKHKMAPFRLGNFCNLAKYLVFILSPAPGVK